MRPSSNNLYVTEIACDRGDVEEEEKKKKLSACRGEGSAAGPLLAARALPLPGVRARCQY